MDGPIKSFVREIFAVRFNPEAHDPEGERIDGSGQCYPNCDGTVWLRSCEKEITDPLKGKVSGHIPKWLNGSLLRNGPGNLKFGDTTYRHLFDSSALLHRFGIKDGEVTYQCKFLRTETYKKNLAAQRIVVTEFGTAAVPDPCQSIFQRVAAVFDPDGATDNSMVSVYPFGDEYYAMSDGPFMHKIDPVTLETQNRKKISDYVGIINHTSHPHVMSDKTVYNLGMSVTKFGPVYNIICFPKGHNMFKNAHIVGSIPCRWKIHPCYMHTFGITKRFFVIVEQPMTVCLKDYVKAQMTNQPMISSLKFFEDKCTIIYLMDRKTGKVHYTYKAEAFFYLHIINCYEQDQHVIVDICCYKDPAMLNCMYIESMMNMQTNPNYAAMFRARPLRFILPLSKIESYCPNTLMKSLSLTSLSGRLTGYHYNHQQHTKPSLKRSESTQHDVTFLAANTNLDLSNNNPELDTRDVVLRNLITLDNTRAEAYKLQDGGIFVRPELLGDIGCETPRINYEKYLGQKYRYFYAISCDVDMENPGTLIKIDVVTKTKKTWSEYNCYPSEPIFVSSPNSQDEDDGVVLAALVWGSVQEDRAGLLVLDAKTWTELGRCVFKCPGPVPKCLHGWYAPSTECGRELHV
ncbi:carotenoid isomerooxygenase [Condylostylus longicornis]|uniref:carotenoid isomerooxygenase n=1 Tax=Condylostylus longicornis TaxID=2530218 RepID=UPI00244E01F7|nr:carotenoid isomerooxygenase [Condylostylus longicornis]XP_055385043.1 carotenoid isomerooxygenase [Condylostylus longicornis]XP_055385044.1 carotenoid isomerooxygenase [Condylostylus longicornis]XP_055385045.1 carotenoid isomerooxygenase [Condylostylus longicornis]